MRFALGAAAGIFVVALLVLILLALVKEGLTLGTLVLIVPSAVIAVLLAIGIGGALFGPRGKR
jgi:hypothetical protein